MTLWGGGSLFLCSVAHCLGVGTCSHVDYSGMIVCMRGLVVSSRGCGSLLRGWPLSRVSVEYDFDCSHRMVNWY